MKKFPYVFILTSVIATSSFLVTLAFLYVFSSLDIKQMLIISTVVTLAISAVSALASWMVADIITAEGMDFFIEENDDYHKRERRYRSGK